MSSDERPPSPVSPRTQARIDALERAKKESDEMLNKMRGYIQNVLNAKLPTGLLIFQAIKYEDWDLFDICVDREKDMVSEHRTLPIIFAAQLGRTEMIAKLLDKGVDINFVVNDGISPRCALYVALQHGKMETFRYLLSRGADVNAIHPAVIASIFVFLKVDRPETMRALLDAGLDLNKQTTQGGSKRDYNFVNYLVSSRESSFDVYKMLMEHSGYDKHKSFSFDAENVISTAKTEEQLEYFFSFFKENNLMRNFGNALYGNCLTLVNFWIEKKGIDYVIDIYRRIISEISGDARYFSLIQLFISKYAPDTRTLLMEFATRVTGGKSLDDVTHATYGFIRRGDVDTFLDFFRVIRERGVRFESKECSSTILSLFSVGRLDIIQQVIECGFTISQSCLDQLTQNADGILTSEKEAQIIRVIKMADFSRLSMPCQVANVNIIKALIEQGADVNGKLGDSTLLHFAVARGNDKLVKFLLENNADVTLRDFEGCTAFEAGKRQLKYTHSTIYQDVLMCLQLLVDHARKMERTMSQDSIGSLE